MQVRTAIAGSPGRHVFSHHSSSEVCCLGRRVLLRGLHDQCWTDRGQEADLQLANVSAHV